MRFALPDGVRCAVALSYDLEMCAGYQPDRVNHGRIMPEAQDYTRELLRVAEEYGVQLHFFYVGNGLDETFGLLQEILERGHVLDSHTYTHLSLRTPDVQRLDAELALTNALFEQRLGWRSTVLRGPGGYPQGLDDLPENQRVILDNGFRWVSCRADTTLYRQERPSILESAARDLPYRYPSGLVEIPIQGLMDRTFFEWYRNVAPDRYEAWRTQSGGRPVADDWRAPWTPPTALEEWMEYHRQAVDFAYERRLVWVPVWHPLTEYLHDRRNVVLRHFLEYCRSKPERVWVCTVRDAAQLLVDAPTPATATPAAGARGDGIA
jgi:peptidoglycan/xylan/chitin deacetylase (PgdA/CDA1 family)